MARAAITGADPVAALADGLDERRIAELDPQPADGRADGGGERVGGLVPYPLEEFFGWDHSVAGAEQALEQGELLGGEHQAPAGPEGRPLAGVEGYVGPLQGRRQGGVDRRARARTRATSSEKSKGLGR